MESSLLRGWSIHPEVWSISFFYFHSFSHPDTRIVLGFIGDNGRTVMAERKRRVLCEYGSEGKLYINERSYTVAVLQPGDQVRIELNMEEKTARFFRNNLSIPIIIKSIPNPAKFYV